MANSGETKPRQRRPATLYAQGVPWEADTHDSGGYVYMDVYPKRAPATNSQPRITHL
ncbi:structural protein [Escherichia coli]|nr:structural protein [Escherichia coli]